MPSKDLVLIGLAVWLVLRMNQANAAQRTAVAGQAGMVPSSNQNTDLWLKTGALKLGGQLLQEIGKGSFANIFTPSTSSTNDSFMTIPGSDGYFGDIGGYDLGNIGYDLGVGTA